MPRYKLTIAYDGTDFHGWQRQEPPGAPPLRTVQGVIEQAVRETVGASVEVLGASRTDAGVHAIGQVAAFSAETRIPIERLARAISSRLPDDVQVLRAEVAPDDFDPISHARRKTYRYSIAHGGPWVEPTAASHQPSADSPFAPLASPPPLFDRRYLYYTYHRLDPVRMHLAARLIVGEHDFASFAQIDHGRATTIRTIFDCSVTATAPDRCHIDVTGSGFLYNMVRIIAGTLLEVGRGRIEPEHAATILAARDRRAAGPTLPPQGLCLRSIEY
ncbi:MAG: tRNA pseudouridine(38-40) synthase TruA [Phycisphaeraceae bacterium]|nr:tRNA pseudouridine(38-40) synthase TruA [Phycisphaerales bacterium]QOJ17390.1 MAG: tRNA pseudouridine(38-40) synthase TruA [Phycisphaeraceae bacterium]